MAPSPRYPTPSSPVDLSPLGAPLTFPFSGKTAPNRFLKAAMSERLSSWSPTDLAARGIPSAALANVYRRWGAGGWGVVLTGNVMLALDQLEAVGSSVIPRDAAPTAGDARFEGFAAVARAAKESGDGSLLVAQVSHPGRQCESRIQKDPVSASDVQLKGSVLGMTFEKPHAASAEEIRGFVDGFAHAAEYLEKAGFDGVELHGAHGYLLAQFLSETTNRRTDEYGGSLENRARLIIEIGQEIRRRTSPSFILGIKLNSVEFQEKGFQPEEAKKLCALLEENKFDFVELSGGTYEQLGFKHERESSRKREAFFLEFADMIAPALTKTKTYVTGGFKTGAAMVDALKSVDGVGLGRPACQEPRLPKDLLQGKVQSAIQQRPPDNDFALSNVVAGSQMRQLGKDHEPIDMSDEENEKAFMKDLGAWGEKMAKDSDMVHCGFVDIESVKPIPYVY
ncbi:NADH-dependent flavin oxidoreductase nadA [Lasiodiplodia theobromae]|uniref:NADH-dependent flavin oxidoreductase nadA n=1 Tax=Lasiodiplodia theobromae TaxID=45133 RepID=A0A5N5DLU9_9PEZI|nr:NADH-dependent flavin oxidoreductase nadA [Lasiodiplodia theobromae]